MALGGRPKEEGGHKPLKISVDDFIYSALNKVENKSRFIEETLRPILKQFDPGETCQLVSEIYKKIAQYSKQPKKGNTVGSQLLQLLPFP